MAKRKSTASACIQPLHLYRADANHCPIRSLGGSWPTRRRPQPPSNCTVRHMQRIQHSPMRSPRLQYHQPSTHPPVLHPHAAVCAGEDHTFGNTIRYILATQPTTDFVGYSIPHPSEHVIHLRLQTKQNDTVRHAMSNACTLLERLCDVMLERFDSAVEEALKEGRTGGGEAEAEEEDDHQMEEID